MCGIFGIIGNVTPATASLCLNRLGHRGPDGTGLDYFKGCILGHRRLAIIDTSPAGHQPMTSPCGRYVITCNGEIYNFLELRKELVLKGHSFKTATDTEVLLQAFAVWGAECLHRLNGMWAMAVWDIQEQRLFLARDRFGKKPLFWSQTPFGLAFASEMKALFPLLPTRTPHPELTRSSRSIMSYEAGPECLITEIQRFPAGHFAFTRGEAPEPRRWWNTLDHLQPVPASFQEQCEQFQELFLNACQLRMRSDVPLGVALSGGLDSSATLCTMAHLAATAKRSGPMSFWNNAFTASFRGTPQDESAKAALVARHVNAHLRTIPIRPDLIPDTLLRDLWLLEEQHLTLPTPFMCIYEAVAAQGVKVTLDGHGADELLAGYGFDYIHAMHDTNPLGWLKIANIFRHSRPDHPQFPRPSRMDLIRKHLSNRINRQPFHAFHGPDERHAAWKSMGALNRVLYHSFHYSVLPTLLRNYDRYSMAAGVEIRMPFMDHRLVSFCFSLPWKSKLRNGYTKAVARHALAPLMPESIVWDRIKIGFNAPFADWARGALKPFLLDTLHSRTFRESELVDQSLASTRLKALLAAKSPTFAQAEACWTAFVPYFWEEAVLKEKGSESSKLNV